MAKRAGKIFILGFMIICAFLSAVQELSAAEKKHIVMIDPAHGGKEAGVNISDKVGEKDINLAIALALQKELAKEGNLEVVLTRDSDKTVSCEDRRKNISKIKPAVFLSLHINSGFGKGATGFEIYYPGFKEATDKTKKFKDGQKNTKNKFISESVRFAQIIQKNFEVLFPRKGRGLREADIPVLEGINVPAVAVEISFASKPEEKKKLLSADSQTEIAKNLAKSIKAFFR
ncbi:MAG: N-acetylmuramoyl-L-alanine amidase [Smithella sp.]